VSRDRSLYENGDHNTNRKQLQQQLDNNTDCGDYGSSEEEWLTEAPVGLRRNISGDGHSSVSGPDYI